MLNWHEPSSALLAWLETQADRDLLVASFTLAEIRRGILAKPAGRKRDALDRWFPGPEGPQALFAGRILPFDEKAGLLWAKLVADGKVANDCIVVSDNGRDFGEVEFINPMRTEG